MATPKLLRTAGRDAYRYPLLIRQLLLNIGQNRTEIVSAGHRFTYADFHDRVTRLAALLRARGVEPGDTVAVMDWDSHRYLECYFAVPMMGAVLQTVNVRLTPATIGFTLRQTEAKVILCHGDFAPIVDQLRDTLPALREVVRLCDTAEPDTYEALIAATPADFPFEDFDEDAIATTFHTTGTTGDPKQVFFSHRQLVLHTLVVATTFANQPDHQGFRRSDVYMPLTPMFHVHAWGMPYVVTMLGLKQVYLGRYDPATILRLKAAEGVTFSHCVPTILRMVLDAAAPAKTSLAPWKLVIGGSALSPDLLDEAAQHGVDVFAGYGMSETGPIVTVARTAPDQPAAIGARAGLPVPLVEVRTDPPGRGELLVRAPWLTQGYGTQDASDTLWEGGWLHTQDIAEIDADGGVRIVDRIKDVIKTGGEWVSSIEIETILTSHPAIVEAAVVAKPCPKWGERPVAFVVAATDATTAPSAEDLRALIASEAAAGRISRYAIPEDIRFAPALPRTSVGKIDKKALRDTA